MLMTAMGLEAKQFFLDLAVFGAGAPEVVPVDLGSAPRAGPDGREHPFGWVGVVWTRLSIMIFEKLHKNIEIICLLTFLLP